MALSDAIEDVFIIEDEALDAINELNSNYEKLTNLKSTLSSELEKLKADETVLRTALAQSKETSREKLARDKRTNDDAIKNLQMALLADDDDDDDDDDTRGDLALRDQSDVAIGSMMGAPSDEEIDENIMLHSHFL